MSDYAVENLARVVEDLRARADNYREEREAARDMADVERKRADAALSRVKELEGVLRKLCNEADGFVSQSDPATHGHTNRAVMWTRIAEARAALAVEGNSKLPTNSEARVAELEKVLEMAAPHHQGFHSEVGRAIRAALAKKGGGT